MVRLRLKHLLLFAACIHLAAAIAICAVGRLNLLPSMFDERGIASFASDSRVYHLQVTALDKTLKMDGVRAWFSTPAPPHAKLYSLSFAVFSPLVGSNILSIEPLNLFYYLATLLLVYGIGREAFDRKQGLAAAGMCLVLLPSFLLHTTQLLKDPLFIVTTLALLLVSVKWLTNEYSVRDGSLVGAVGGGAAASLWLIKNSVWWLVLAIIFLSGLLLVVRVIRQRTLLAGNLAGLVLTILMAVSASQVLTPYWMPREFWAPYRPGQENSTNSTVTADGVAPTTNSEALNAFRVRDERQSGLSSRVAGKIGRARARFVELYPEARSNIDAHVQLTDAADVVRYLPRALLIGLCAPFPTMWLRSGDNVGTFGRLMSGFETFAVYLVLVLALCSVWRNRRQLPVHLIISVALLGVVALGLVVVNVGALYRQRYVFWMMFIIVGAKSLVQLLPTTFVGGSAEREKEP